MKKGFTLIELLVVIAIIGILSGVVLTSLGTARSKGSDAAVKANLDGIRAQAEIVYDTDGDYDDVCADDTVEKAFNAAVAAGNGAGTCVDSTTNWAVSAQLKTNGDSALYWCVDSTGTASSTATDTTAGGDCA